jgi:hypothetical protein
VSTLNIVLIASIILVGGGSARGADVVGTVLNNRGEPVSGVTVSVVNSAGSDAGKGVSDAHGRYSISNLTPGVYKLGASGQWVMSYIGDRGLTVNWGLAPHAMPVAVGRQGTAADPSMTTSAAPAKISQARTKDETGGSD